MQCRFQVQISRLYSNLPAGQAAARLNFTVTVNNMQHLNLETALLWLGSHSLSNSVVTP